MNPRSTFPNPYRPGAGHMPPYLAGRQPEIEEFKKLLDQNPILENMILTGLRGVGKTVLLDTFKPIAVQNGWAWVGTDMSESSSVSEERMATRLLTDLSIVTSGLRATTGKKQPGFMGEAKFQNLNFETLGTLYKAIPGLASDKLKGVLETVWRSLPDPKPPGFVFAYDEAQNISDHAAKEEYPLSLLLEVFQSVQKKGFPFLLVLTGLPTLFPKLVEARTFSERMFHIVTLSQLSAKDSREAILRPVDEASCPIHLTDESVQTVIDSSGGYPYFIQFICKEVYDVFIQNIEDTTLMVPIDAIIRKLDEDFFAGRWARVTDRQRDLLWVVAQVKTKNSEFTVQEVSDLSRKLLTRPFSPSHINQMLLALSNHGLIFKNRYGKYSFAVPLLGDFILRQRPADDNLPIFTE